MSITMYGASVPVFRHYLRQLSTIVARAQNDAAQHGMEEDVLLGARLAPSMYPFATQVEIAVNFVPRACAPLAGIDVPPARSHPSTFDGLQARIADAQALLDTLTPGQMEAGAERMVTDRAGLAVLSLPGSEFLFQYALPNFIFHVTTAYAILRHQGLDIGKGDFDGYHRYAGEK